MNYVSAITAAWDVSDTINPADRAVSLSSELYVTRTLRLPTYITVALEPVLKIYTHISDHSKKNSTSQCTSYTTPPNAFFATAFFSPKVSYLHSTGGLFLAATALDPVTHFLKFADPAKQLAVRSAKLSVLTLYANTF
jgi:hypothetical protein